MRYDLAELTRRTKTRRREIVLPPLEPPRALESELASVGLEVVRFWQTGIAESVLPAYEQARSEMIRDEAADWLANAFSVLSSGTERLVMSVTRRLEAWAVQVETWHRSRWASSVQSSTGVDVRLMLSSHDAAEQVRLSLEWASVLVRGLSDDMRRKLESITYQGLVSQTPRREMAKQLSAAIGVGKRRAQFIAEDQTLKLSGNLDRMRQQEAGIDAYRWRTAMDERVRPTHGVMEGKVVEWSKPPAIGHPRTEPRCRCVAQAYIPLMDED